MKHNIAEGNRLESGTHNGHEVADAPLHSQNINNEDDDALCCICMTCPATIIYHSTLAENRPEHKFCSICVEHLYNLDSPCPLCRFQPPSQFTFIHRSRSLASDATVSSDSTLTVLQYAQPLSIMYDDLVINIFAFSDHSCVIHVYSDNLDGELSYVMDYESAILQVNFENFDHLVHRHEFSYFTEMVHPRIPRSFLLSSQLNGNNGSYTGTDDHLSLPIEVYLLMFIFSLYFSMPKFKPFIKFISIFIFLRVIHVILDLILLSIVCALIYYCPYGQYYARFRTIIIFLCFTALPVYVIYFLFTFILSRFYDDLNFIFSSIKVFVLNASINGNNGEATNTDDLDANQARQNQGAQRRAHNRRHFSGGHRGGNQYGPPPAPVVVIPEAEEALVEVNLYYKVTMSPYLAITIILTWLIAYFNYLAQVPSLAFLRVDLNAIVGLLAFFRINLHAGLVHQDAYFANMQGDHTIVLEPLRSMPTLFSAHTRINLLSECGYTMRRAAPIKLSYLAKLRKELNGSEPDSSMFDNAHFHLREEADTETVRNTIIHFHNLQTIQTFERLLVNGPKRTVPSY
jgi:hypothetical protein